MMTRQNLFLVGILALVAALLPVRPAEAAYEVPGSSSKVQYFYVFGPGGLIENGREDSIQDIYVDVSAESSEPVTIEILDPETGGKIDSVGGTGGYTGNTSTRITVEGSAKLDERVFTNEKETDGKWVKFGPYAPSKGRKEGDVYRFRVRVHAFEGDDQNLFRFRISPDSAATFSDSITFRLGGDRGSKMYFYPFVPEGETRIVVNNYDLDSDGGSSELKDTLTGRMFGINDSTSGKWSQTRISLASGEARRLEYIVTRKGQPHGNAGLKVTDESGKALPIYFRMLKRPEPKAAPAPAPEPKPAGNACNRFTFDARSSYDPNDDRITYEWNLGDGTVSAEPVVTHVYDKAGVYRVTLKVTDNSGLQCNTAESAQEVKVNTPPQAGFQAPELVCRGTTVSFDASATQDNAPADLTYFWKFGDGTTAEGQKVTKTFEKGGVYDVVLMVDDNAGTVCSTDSIVKTVRVNSNPKADAGKDVTLYLEDASKPYAVRFDAAGSGDPDGNDLTYNWNFGDGAAGEGRSVDHVFQNPGNYEARLTVNDQSGTPCAVDSDTVKIVLNKAPVAEAGKPQFACSGAELTFDGSGSTTEAGENLKYTWNFGDGATAEGAVVKHRYAKGGRYTVSLTVDDGRGTPVSISTDSVSVDLNSAPKAEVTNIQKACVSDKVLFDASGSSDPDGDSLKYIWDFGDGTKAEGGAKVSHAYQKGGSYAVTVRVDDGRGSACSQAVARASVKINTPPAANAGPNLACCEDQQTTFDGSASSDADGDALTYNWNFGDGGGADTAKVSHAYADSGVYQVTLTVDDQSGTSCSASTSGFQASVNAKPVPVIKVSEG